MQRISGRVVTATGVFPGSVVVAGEQITWVGPEADLPAAYRDLAVRRAHYVLPGLVDLHCHGGDGFDFGTASPEEIVAIAACHLRHGTTTLLATIATAPVTEMIAATKACADAATAGHIAGIHIEGPFLAAKRCGALNAKSFIPPDIVVARQLFYAAGSHLVTMTIAAEMAGASEVIVDLAQGGVIPSLGHTDASGEQAEQFARLAQAALADDAVTARITHLFNAMRPIHHRDPGPALLGLAMAAQGKVVVELIADGIHLDALTIRSAFELAHADNIALVTDSMAVTGLGDGLFGTVRVRAGAATAADGHTLAGGTFHLIDIVRKVAACGVSLCDAVTAATATPARAIGRNDIGVLAAGKRADVLLADESLQVCQVMQAGRWA